MAENEAHHKVTMEILENIEGNEYNMRSNKVKSKIIVCDKEGEFTVQIIRNGDT